MKTLLLLLIAAIAYDKRILEIDPEFATLNFPQGSITSGHVSVEEPRQDRLTLTLKKTF